MSFKDSRTGGKWIQESYYLYFMCFATVPALLTALHKNGYSLKIKADTEYAASRAAILAAVRIALCAFPQNNWAQNSSDMAWGIIRNVPFAALGAVICVLYYRRRNESRRFRPVWIYILLSFAFYIPVAVGAGAVPMLGMLMLPKTVCYILLILAFLLATLRDGPAEGKAG